MGERSVEVRYTRRRDLHGSVIPSVLTEAPLRERYATIVPTELLRRVTVSSTATLLNAGYCTFDQTSGSTRRCRLALYRPREVPACAQLSVLAVVGQPGEVVLERS